MKRRPLITFCGSRKYDKLMRKISTRMKNNGYDVLMPESDISLEDFNTSHAMKGMLESNYFRILKSDLVVFFMDSTSDRFMTDMEIGYTVSLKRQGPKSIIAIHDDNYELDKQYSLILDAIFDSWSYQNLQSKKYEDMVTMCKYIEKCIEILRLCDCKN